MAYGDFKNLTGRTACDNILHNKAFNIAKYVIAKIMMDITGVLLQWFTYVLIKTLRVELLKMKICQTKS